MGKVKSAAYLTRQAQLATARENYYKTRTASTTTTVTKRPIDTYVYNSYMLKDSAGNSMQMRVNASAAAVTFFGEAAALGLIDPATASKSIGKKAKEFVPAQVHAMIAGTAPSAKVTSWGTRVIKYSANTTGTSQAFYTAPICADATALYDEVAAKARTIYAARKGTMGPEDYHRFWLSPEIYNIQEN